jgi:hypothetical protein
MKNWWEFWKHNPTTDKREFLAMLTVIKPLGVGRRRTHVRHLRIVARNLYEAARKLIRWLNREQIAVVKLSIFLVGPAGIPRKIKISLTLK